MTQQTDQVRVLLATAADQMPGGPVTAPAEQLLARARRGRRQHRRMQLAAAFALVLIAAGVPAAFLSRSPVGPALLPGYAVPTVTAYPAAPDLTRYRWSALPAAPIDGRAQAATVWTGREMVVWGGCTAQCDRAYADGAAFDPSTNRWRTLPASPLSARYDPAYVWTGSQLFVWGGLAVAGGQPAAVSDGALYDPATNQWRPVAASPLTGRAAGIALWTGREVVVLGGASPLDAAAYDPAADTWRRLPEIPIQGDWQIDGINAVATPDGIDAWLYWEHREPTSDGFSETSGVAMVRYDPATGRWQTSNTDVPKDLGTPIWTGRELIFPAAPTFYGNIPHPFSPAVHGWRWDPAVAAWVAIPAGPVDGLEAASLWTGSVLLDFDSGRSEGNANGTTVFPGQAAAWDPATGKWTRLPAAPLGGVQPGAVWTGRELLEWGLMYPTHPGDAGDPTTGGQRFGP